jgi:hypothetical protein
MLLLGFRRALGWLKPAGFNCELWLFFCAVTSRFSLSTLLNGALLFGYHFFGEYSPSGTVMVNVSPDGSTT